MPKLARLIRKVLRRGRVLQPASAAGPKAPEDLADLLPALVARARESWPKLAVEPTRFSERLQTIAAATSKPAAALSALFIEDLYLAQACLDRVPGAAEQFERRLRSDVAAVVGRMAGASDLQDDIAQKLLTKFLVGTAKRPPALADYRGFSDLGLFLRVSAQRLAINSRRDSRNRLRLLDQVAKEIHLAQPGAEHLLARSKFRRPFLQALRVALAELEPRDRLMLRLHLVAGMSTRRLAKLYKMNQATVARRLARTREAVWTQVRHELRTNLLLDSAEVDSVLRMVQSDDDISLSSLLTEPDPERDK